MKLVYDKSWGYLGKPPQEIMDGSAPKERQALYKRYVSEVQRIQKMANSKRRAVELASIKAKYNRDFALEE